HSAVLDSPGEELALRPREDQVRPARPLTEVGDVRARRLGRIGRVRGEDGELVPFVLEEEVHRVKRLEGEAIGARGFVERRQIPPGAPVPHRDQAAGLVRRPGVRVFLESTANRVGDSPQWPLSIAASVSAASQKSAERYFPPPSASTQTTTLPSSSS